MQPGEDRLDQELAAEGRADRLARERRDRERQRAELEDGHQVRGVLGVEPGQPAAGDLDVAAGDRVLDDRRRDDRAVERDREVAPDVLARCSRRTVLAPSSFSTKSTAGRPFWSVPTVAEATWSPLNSGGNCLRSSCWPSVTWVEPSGTKSSRPVWPTSLRTASGSVTPGSSTTTRSAPWVVTTGSETPVVFTRRSTMSLMTRHVAGRRRLALDRQRLVFDAQAALEVEAQLRLDRPPRPVGALRVGKLEPGEEIDEEGDDPDEQDEDRTGFTHRGGMLHGTVAYRRRGDGGTSERRRTLRVGRRVRGSGMHVGGVPWARDPGRVDPATIAVADSETVRGTMKNSLSRPATPAAGAGQASSVALIRAASDGPIPGTAAICSTGASRTRLIEPNTLSSSRLRFGPTPGQVVERGADGPSRPQVAVIGDREAVRLVAQALDEVERRRGRRQDDRVGPVRAGTAPRAPWPGRPAAGRGGRARRGPPCAALTWPLPPSTMTRSGIAQRRASSTPSSPVRTERKRRRRTSWWLAKSFGPWTVLIRKRRYSPGARLAVLEDDHAADRFAALEVADVVALDAQRRPGQPERLGQLLERGQRLALVGQPARLLAGERLAGVPRGQGQELALLAALRDAEVDRAAATLGEERLEDRGLGDRPPARRPRAGSSRPGRSTARGSWSGPRRRSPRGRPRAGRRRARSSCRRG